MPVRPGILTSHRCVRYMPFAPTWMWWNLFEDYGRDYSLAFHNSCYGSISHYDLVLDSFSHSSRFYFRWSTCSSRIQTFQDLHCCLYFGSFQYLLLNFNFGGIDQKSNMNTSDHIGKYEKSFIMMSCQYLLPKNLKYIGSMKLKLACFFPQYSCYRSHKEKAIYWPLHSDVCSIL